MQPTSIPQSTIAKSNTPQPSTARTSQSPKPNASAQSPSPNHRAPAPVLLRRDPIKKRRRLRLTVYLISLFAAPLALWQRREAMRLWASRHTRRLKRLLRQSLLAPETVEYPRLPETVEKEILLKLWSSRILPCDAEAYFRFFNATCGEASSDLPLDSADELLKIVGILGNKSNTPLEDFLADVDLEFLPAFKTKRGATSMKDDADSADAIYEAVCFAIQLWLLFDLDLFLSTSDNPGELPPESLVGVLKQAFPKDSMTTNAVASSAQAEESNEEQEEVKTVNNSRERDKWSRLLTLRDLELLGGFKILFVDNLQDHLLLSESDDGQISICIFHHCTMLEQFHSSSPIFPPGLLSETLQTLALLLPMRDKATRAWYAAQCQKAKVDQGVILDSRAVQQLRRQDARLKTQYPYWRRRLDIISDVFDETEPQTLRQWWTDPRRGVQRWTFWLTAVALILSVFFSFLQTVIGTFQVALVYVPPGGAGGGTGNGAVGS